MSPIRPISPILAPAPQTAQRFEVGCEGELLESFPTAAEALRYAQSWSEFTACPYEIFDAATHACLAIVDPPKEAA